MAGVHTGNTKGRPYYVFSGSCLCRQYYRQAL